jgi:hypothetical protein
VLADFGVAEEGDAAALKAACTGTEEEATEGDREAQRRKGKDRSEQVENAGEGMRDAAGGPEGLGGRT